MDDIEFLRLVANDLRFHVAAAGPRDGPRVLLLHGFPESWYGWRHQLLPLAQQGLRVYAPDLRGYNLSDKPAARDAYVMDLLVADVIGLADALGAREFTLVGHNWGGVLAWQVAAVHPARVRRLVVLNAPRLSTVWPHMLRHPLQFARGWYVGFFQMPALPEWALQSSNFGWMTMALQRTSRPGTFTDKELDRYRAAWSQPGAMTAMLNWYRALPLYAGGIAPARIRPPTRILWGDHDAALDSSLAEDALALCDEAEVLHLPQATHWLQHEEADIVTAQIAAFCR